MAYSLPAGHPPPAASRGVRGQRPSSGLPGGSSAARPPPLRRAVQPATATLASSRGSSRGSSTSRSFSSSSTLRPPAPQQLHEQLGAAAEQPQDQRTPEQQQGVSSSSNSSRRPVIGKMVGKSIVQGKSGHAVVPLLHPVRDQLPFAAALSIITSAGVSPGAAAAASAATHQQQQEQKQQDAASASSSSLVELCYCVSGRGFVTSAVSGPQQLLPGDSLIALQGAASFAAGPLPPAKQPEASSAAESHHQQRQQQPPMWSQLLSWLHTLHPRPQPGHHQQQPQQPGQRLDRPDAAGRAAGNTAKQQQQLVLLQLLLPSELLTGQLLMHHAGLFDGVARHLPWSAAAAAAASDGGGHAGVAAAAAAAGHNVDEDGVCAFLVDRAAAAEQQHEQQHEQSEDQASPAASQAELNGQLSQQQVLKRALSEVGAYRLPHQTNRLALLFSPYVSPGLSLSFGVEIFEPGHVTPLHVHSTAHELFFVLAGHGEGVFVPSSSSSGNTGEPPVVERVRLSPGDVAVFPPGVLHGVDNPDPSSQLYCLQMMLPNEDFVEMVRSGQAAGVLDVGMLHRRAAEAASCG